MRRIRPYALPRKFAMACATREPKLRPVMRAWSRNCPSRGRGMRTVIGSLTAACARDVCSVVART